MECTDGLASTAATTAAARFDTVLFEVSVVCVTRARIEVCFGVVFGALILVSDEESNRCPKGNTMLDSRLDVDEILLVSLQMKS